MDAEALLLEVFQQGRLDDLALVPPWTLLHVVHIAALGEESLEQATKRLVKRLFDACEEEISSCLECCITARLARTATLTLRLRSISAESVNIFNEPISSSTDFSCSLTVETLQSYQALLPRYHEDWQNTRSFLGRTYLFLLSAQYDQ
jgi:hypothetical protein